MKHIDWNKDKNAQLKARYEICFDEIVPLLNKADGVLAVVPHPNQLKYPNQKMFIIEIDKYAYLIPFVEDNEKYFLKTIIPSRKATKKYISK
ncbi:MAG: toxin [Parcubacteria group bacterium]|nr:toxin [Parcubacteria group bacterium]